MFKFRLAAAGIVLVLALFAVWLVSQAMTTSQIAQAAPRKEPFARMLELMRQNGDGEVKNSADMVVYPRLPMEREEGRGVGKRR
jgi:hypothetical protein